MHVASQYRRTPLPALQLSEASFGKRFFLLLCVVRLAQAHSFSEPEAIAECQKLKNIHESPEVQGIKVGGEGEDKDKPDKGKQAEAIIAAMTKCTDALVALKGKIEKKVG